MIENLVKDPYESHFLPKISRNQISCSFSNKRDHYYIIYHSTKLDEISW